MRSPSASSGKITSGLAPNQFLERTIEFVADELHGWRDDGTRPHAEAEEELNGQLCKYLNVRAGDNFPLAFFHHEERQGKGRRVDVSVLPTLKAITAALYESIYDPFLVIEGKRLPMPSKEREREYLTGLDKKSGGVQRFRLCLHGKALNVAIMVGYVASGEVGAWRTTINDWIGALETSGEDTTCKWSGADHFGELQHDGKAKAARCESSHERLNGQPKIRLIHLWICMPEKPKDQAHRRRAG